MKKISSVPAKTSTAGQHLFCTVLQKD